MYVDYDDYTRIEKKLNNELLKINKSNYMYVTIYGWNCDGNRESRTNKIRIKENKVNFKDLKNINIFVFFEGLNYMSCGIYNNKIKIKTIEYIAIK